MLLQTWPWELEEVAHESRFPGAGEAGPDPWFPALRPMFGTVWSILHLREALRPLFRNLDKFPNFSPSDRHLFFFLS